MSSGKWGPFCLSLNVLNWGWRWGRAAALWKLAPTQMANNSGKYPCAVCHCGVGNNSMECSQCKLWVHKKCSDITGRLEAHPDYICLKCRSKAQLIDGRPVTCVEVDGTTLAMEDTFCYLGDMLCASRGCDSATAARCCRSLGQFGKLLPILTIRHLMCAAGYTWPVCIRLWSTVAKYGDWTPLGLKWLCRNEHCMIRWICGTKIPR